MMLEGTKGREDIFGKRMVLRTPTARSEQLFETQNYMLAVLHFDGHAPGVCVNF